MGEESSAAVQGGPRNLKEKSNEEIRELYDNAVWYASRCSLLGAGGFGVALVMFDDADDPDAYGDAYDVGLGVRYMATRNWLVRAEWILRRQAFSVWRPGRNDQGAIVLQDDAVSLWGRSLRIGASYVF